MDANYKIYQVKLRVTDDEDLIQFVEQNKAKLGTTEIFRQALSQLKNEGI